MGPEAGPAVERSPAAAVTFGPYAFDARNGLLSRNGAEIPLPPRVIGVLGHLLARPGEVVSRQELLDGVWKDAFVTDTSLAEAVSFLRQALGDDPQAPRYIQTVHRRGYRFVAPLGPAAPTGAASPHTPVLAPPERAVRPQRPDITPVDADVDGQARVSPSIVGDLVPWSIATISAVLAIAALWHIAREPAPMPAPVARFEIRPPAGSSFDRRAPAFAISNDGRTIAWSGCDGSSGACGVFVRPLDRLEATRLGGTDGGSAPFFSPDGRWLGFFADGKLKKIAIAGGAATTLADAPTPGGASWNVDGRIIFSGAPAGGLTIVSDQGGEVRAITTPRVDRGEVRHVWPSWLADGQHAIFTIVSSLEPGAAGQLAILTPPSSAFRILRSGVMRGAAAGRGYLLLASGRDVQGVTFDERTLAITGAADTVLGDLASAGGLPQFAVSASGTLVAQNAAPVAPRVVWHDAADLAIGGLARLSSIALSPDDTRVAGVIADGAGSDIWIARLDTGALTRLTFGGTNVSPVWSADGSRVFFATRTDGPFALAVRDVDDRGAARIVAAGAAHLFPASASRDGSIAVTLTLPSHRLGIGIVPPGGGAPRVLSDGPVDEAAPAFSPDGAWVAYASDESGRWDVFARRIADGRRVAVSTEGGHRPAWSRDGQWIVFQNGARLFRVRFTAAGEVKAGAPEQVFARPGASVLAVAGSGRVLIAEEPVTLDRATVAIEWLRELRQRLPPPLSAPR
jgi:DNA-binding winged helix-turn-helix (wHTH) protein/Tol biopolymer transport system component